MRQHLDHPVYLKYDTIEVPYEIKELEAEVSGVDIAPREYIKGSNDVTIENVEFGEGQEFIPEMDKDYEIVSSTIDHTGECIPANNYTVKYQIRSLNNNMKFKDPLGNSSEVYNGKVENFEVTKATISVKSVNASSKNYKKDDLFIDVSSAEFEGSSLTEQLAKGTEYKIDSDGQDYKGKITDGNCNPGIHTFNCTVTILSECYHFDGQTTSVICEGNAEINKIPIIINKDSVKAIDRTYDFDDFLVEIEKTSVQFKGVREELPLNLDKDFTVTDGYIKEQNCDAGNHVVQYRVDLKNTGNYQFADSAQ